MGPNFFHSLHFRGPTPRSGGSDCLQENDKTSTQTHPENRLEKGCCLSVSVSFGSKGKIIYLCSWVVSETPTYQTTNFLVFTTFV